MIATDREKEIIKLVCEGFKSQDIAKILSVTQATIKWHLTNIYRNNGCVNRADLIIKYMRGKNAT